MASDRIDVRHVAKLARLALTDDEVTLYGAQLGNLLAYVDEMRELDTTNVTATAQVVESRNVQRPDALRPGLSREDALARAPQAENGFFRVPKIIAAD
ncbi:MAG: Asp-tRNA(Asn)/Glu-tRNA(Gln) amidotransferase subunit GatC [Candidatus Velthaea sp.]